MCVVSLVVKGVVDHTDLKFGATGIHLMRRRVFFTPCQLLHYFIDLLLNSLQHNVIVQPEHLHLPAMRPYHKVFPLIVKLFDNPNTILP